MPSISVPVGTAIASGLAEVGVGATTAGLIGSVAGPALMGAGTGALSSLLTGGKPLKGALYGGLTGGALGGLGLAFPETMAGIPGSGVGGSQAILGADGNWIPGAQGFPDMATMGADGNWIPGPAGFSGSGVGSSDGGGFLSSLLGGGAPGSNPQTAFSNRSLGLGALSALSAAFNRPTRPNYGLMPGPDTTAATRGPLFNAPLQTSGYLNRTPTPNYQPASGDFYTWGEQGGSMPFFSNNQLTFPSLPGMARGGALNIGEPTMMARGGPRGYVRGGGDGTSDAIPARLSDSEYVLTAADVSRIGQGSSEAGARKLDQMRAKIARDAGARKHQGKVKHPLQYLKQAGAR